MTELETVNGTNENKVVMTIDIGGSNIKARLSNGSDKRRVESGPHMTPQVMVDAIKDITKDWSYDFITMGYPGAVADNKPTLDPFNLGPGWLGFDFEKAFQKPLRVVNDAMMQAIGSYEGGRMLFLGLGTGLGAAMVANNVCLPMELAHLPYKKEKTFEDYVGERGLDKHGKPKWREYCADVIHRLDLALQPDYIVLGGGNADKLKEMPPKCRLGTNENAFLGGARVWLQPNLQL